MSRAVPITRKILAEAAALPLRDAAWQVTLQMRHSDLTALDSP